MERTATYGRRILAARMLAGLSREQLADAVELSANTIGRYERGHGAPPKRPVRQAIARACSVPEWFIESGIQNDESPPQPKP